MSVFSVAVLPRAVTSSLFPYTPLFRSCRYSSALHSSTAAYRLACDPYLIYGPTFQQVLRRSAAARHPLQPFLYMFHLPQQQTVSAVLIHSLRRVLCPEQLSLSVSANISSG